MTWRPKGFRLGKMRERVAIQESTDTLDSVGQPTRAWTATYSSEPASWQPLRGQESLRGEQVEAGITDMFTLRYRPDITPQMRVVHAGRNYGIVHVRQVEGGRRYIELMCKAVV